MPGEEEPRLAGLGEGLPPPRLLREREGTGKSLQSPSSPPDTFQVRAALDVAPLQPGGQGLLPTYFTATPSVLSPLPLLGQGPQLSKAERLEELNNHSGKSVKWEPASLPALNHCLFEASSLKGRSG